MLSQLGTEDFCSADQLQEVLPEMEQGPSMGVWLNVWWLGIARMLSDNLWTADLVADTEIVLTWRPGSYLLNKHPYYHSY